jgi:hypothetical protein
MTGQAYLPGMGPAKEAPKGKNPSYEIFPYGRGQYVVAVRSMPVRDDSGRPTGQTRPRRIEGDVIRADNQTPPRVTVRQPSGELFNVWATEVRVRYLHGKPDY